MNTCPHCGGELPGPEDKTPTPEALKVIETWNAFAEKLDLPKVRPGNGKILAQIKTRMKSKTFQDDLALAMSQILVREFYRGANTAGWKASLEWLLKSGKIQELAEARRADVKASEKKGGVNGPEAGRLSSRKRAD